MTFLHPALLWLLLAAALPIAIHLLNRRRHKTVKWAAMQFLLKATRETRGRKRLRHILILTCRALGIAALVAAAALPVVSGLLGFGSGKPELVVLVLDRSASMEAVPEGGSIPRRELALQRVRDALAELPGTRLVLVDSASGQAQEVAAPEVLAELTATAATDTAADLPSLLATATSYLAENPARSELWVASDLQHSNWVPDDERWASLRAGLAALPQAPRLRILALAGKPAANQSLRILSARRSGDALVLDLELRRDEGDTPLALPLTTAVDGARRTESVTLAGQRLRLRKSVALDPRRDAGWGSVTIPGDGNLRDNAALFAYGPARPVRSAVVAPPGETADYLLLASAPDGFGGQQSERFDPGAPLPLDELAAVFWAAPLPAGESAEPLRAFVEDGGQLLLFAPAEDAETSFLDLRWSTTTRAAADRFFVLDRWDHDDGLLRDGIDGSAIPADRLRAIQRRLPLGDAPVFARWDDDEPFLVRQVLSRGTAWFVGTQPDYGWSNLGDADVLLPLVQRAVAAGSERHASGHLAELGSREARPGAGETRPRVGGETIPGRGDPLHSAGVVRSDDRLLALNRPAREDEPEVLDLDALPALLEGVDFQLFEDRSHSARENVTRSVWRAFLVATLCFLIAEAALCLNRPLQPTPPGGPGQPSPAR